MGRLIDADILINELKESALHHCNNLREDSLLQRDRVIVRAQPTVEAIPKDQYETKLKADLEAILVELQLKIEEMSGLVTEIHGEEWNEINVIHSQDVLSFIQQKINELKRPKGEHAQ